MKTDMHVLITSKGDSFNTHIVHNGVPLKNVSEMTIVIKPDQLVQATVTLIGTEILVDAELHVEYIILPDGKRYQVVAIFDDPHKPKDPS